MPFVKAKGKDRQKWMTNVRSWEAGLCNIVLGTGSDMVGCGCGDLILLDQ